MRHLDDPFLTRQLSRRNVLAGLGGLGIAAMLPLAGCNQRNPDSPAAAQASIGPPRRGGVLRLAYADSPDTLDLHRTMSYPGRQVSTLIYDSLTRLDADNQPQPSLATRWWAEKDAEEWVFELRQGVRFHHGRAFTSADVVASIERIEDPANGFGSAGSFGPLKAVQPEGEHRVRLIYRQRFGEAPLVVAHDATGIVPADRLSQLASAPSGTGAFRLRDYQPGSSVSLERNPDYWNPGRPYLDGVEVRAIREPVAQQGALQAGEIDLITMLSPEAYLSLKSHPNVRAYSAANGSHHVLLTQANLAPFDDSQVREAFRYLIDRESLVASALLGQGRVGNDLPFAPGTPYYPDIASHRQDLNKARQLLQAAGVDRLDLELWTSSERPPAPKMALAVAQAAEKIGIRLQVRDRPFSEYVSQISRKQPLYTNYQPGWPTLYQGLYRAFRSGEGYNYGGREQFPGADAMLEDLISEPDAQRRHERAAALLVPLSRFSERIVPYFQNYLAASTRRVHGFVPPPYMMIDVQNIWLEA